MPWYVAFPVGLMVYFMYLGSQARGDGETLAYFGRWLYEHSLTVMNGLAAYIALFVLGCFADLSVFGIRDGVFTVSGLLAISWGPMSLFNAYKRVANGKTQ